jgi:hypothetical protein
VSEHADAEASAEQAEVSGIPTTFEWKGTVYEIDPDPTIETMAYFSRGHNAAAIEGLVGPEQWRHLGRSARRSELDELAGHIAVAMGFKTAGE